MRILNLTVNNLGVFRGPRRFDFTPTHKGHGKYRHLVAVSGQNGVGKSTLFQSLGLALHGSLSLSDRVSRQDYSKYLLSRLHRSNDMGVSVASPDGGVEISFEYVRSGKPLRVEIKRYWHWNGTAVSETLRVSCDGKPPNVDPDDYQTWINDLVPPGLAGLCFFDAEQLEAFSSPAQQGGLMADALRRLLGLDLVGRLQSDLERYTLLRGGHKAAESLRAKALGHQAAVEELDAKIESLQEQSAALAAEHVRAGAELSAQESRLAAEGSSYAARRPALRERLAQIQTETKRVAAEIEELSGELLPFCLAPELCLQLGRRLIEEAKMHLCLTAEGVWQERVENLRAVLSKDDWWEGISLSARARGKLIERIVDKLRGTSARAGEEASKFIHNLAEPERDKLHEWIRQTLQDVPAQARKLCDELRGLQEEQRRIEDELQRAPDDDVLAPLHAELLRLQESLQVSRKRQDELAEQTGALRYQREEHARQLQRVDEELRKAQENEQRLALAERSRLALQVYKDALVGRRIAALEEKFLASFNAICRKERLLSGVRIDPETFDVELRGVEGERLNVGELSAGERQLYALSWLWALRQVSGHQLPLAIDTPLARLDDVHRSRFVNDYVPAVSDQVILFATDVEMDAELLRELKPHLARLYQLHYDQAGKETFVNCFDQSTSGEVTLYRAKRSAKHGRENDFNGGYGQVWLYDAEHARSYGEPLSRAVLPRSAKRLMLIEPKSNAYNWLHVAELEKIVDQKYILNQLRNGHQIYDLWKDEWTRRLLQAGYDSVATANIEGPLEYVLDESKLIQSNGKTA